MKDPSWDLFPSHFSTWLPGVTSPLPPSHVWFQALPSLDTSLHTPPPSTGPVLSPLRTQLWLPVPCFLPPQSQDSARPLRSQGPVPPAPMLSFSSATTAPSRHTPTVGGNAIPQSLSVVYFPSSSFPHTTSTAELFLGAEHPCTPVHQTSACAVF